MITRSLSRTRFVSVFMLIALFAICAGALVGSGRCDPPAMRVMAVAPGDTLWELATRYGPPHQDVRITVDVIFRANHLTSTRLVVGQRLLVPVGRSATPAKTR